MINCPICKQGEKSPSYKDYTYTKNENLVVIRKVPADVCDFCGHAFFQEDVAQHLFDLVQSALTLPAAVSIFEFDQPPIAA
jgi:YgiT-type zinc finger domain-containing protein